MFLLIFLITDKLRCNLTDGSTDCRFEIGLLARTDLEIAARLLKAIAHPIRLQILCKLGPSEVSVQEIVNSVGTSQSNISQHLSAMRDIGVLSARKVANRVFYRIKSESIIQLIGNTKIQKRSEITA